MFDECKFIEGIVGEDCEQSAQTPLAKNRSGSSSSNVLAPGEPILESDIQNYETLLKKQFIGNTASAKDIQQAALMSGKASAHGTNNYTTCCNYGKTTDRPNDM